MIMDGNSDDKEATKCPWVGVMLLLKFHRAFVDAAPRSVVKAT